MEAEIIKDIESESEFETPDLSNQDFIGESVSDEDEKSSDDYGSKYLIGRQVANEYNDPITQSYIRQLETAEPGIWQKMQPGPDGKPQVPPEQFPRSKTQAPPGKTDFITAGAKGPVDEFGRPIQPQQVAQAQATESDPLIDPMTVAGTAAGASFTTNVMKRAGLPLLEKLIPSAGRAMASGVISGAAEYPIGITTEGMAKETGVSPLLLNVGLGLASGFTLERFAEDALAKLANRGAKVVVEVPEIVKAIQKGDFENPVARAVHEAWARHVANETGLFLGEKAKFIDLQTFRRAKRAVEELDADPEKVRLATGFFRGEDGKWRWELSDQDYKLDTDALLQWAGKQYLQSLPNVVTHPKLFENYPELRDMHIQAVPMYPKDRRGAYNPDTNTIMVNSNLLKDSPDEIRGTVLHEIQHWIQDTEGFAQGTSLSTIEALYPKTFEKEFLRIRNDDGSWAEVVFHAAQNKVTVNQMHDAMARFNTYLKVAGETESRDVVQRWMNKENFRMANLEQAKVVFNDYLQETQKQLKLFPDELPFIAEQIDYFTKKMSQLGFNLNDRATIQAFMSGDFSEIIPPPALIKYAKSVVWKMEEYDESDEFVESLAKVFDTAAERSQKISESWKPTYVNARQYAREMRYHGSETPAQKAERRDRYEKDNRIRARVREENPPPSMTDPEFAKRDMTEQKRLMEEWKKDLNEKTNVAIANATSRASGAVGPNAMVPAYVRDTSEKGESILDFGAGKSAAHAAILKEEGFNVTAHDFGENVQEGVHDAGALSKQYDTVYASNVLNVQGDEEMLRNTLKQISSATNENGRAVFNYPESPRKGNLQTEDVERVIKEFFPNVKRVGGTKSAPVWEAKKFEESAPVQELVESLDLNAFPSQRAVKKAKASVTPRQMTSLYGMGPGAAAGFEYDPETKEVSFDPERAIIGMVAGIGAIKFLEKRAGKVGTGITTPTKGGRYLRGAVSNQDTVATVEKHLDSKIIDRDWDGVDTVEEAASYAKETMRWIQPQVVNDPVKLRYQPNKLGMYGNDKMEFPSEAYPKGRNTWDIPGCGREAFAKQNGLEQTFACYGGKCYAEVDFKRYGKGSVASGLTLRPVMSRGPEADLRSEIEKSVKEIGLELTQKKYPDLVIAVSNYKGKVGKVTVKRVISDSPTAKVSTNLEPANGQDVRLGVDTDGSAWLVDSRVMDAIVEANPRTLSVYSSCYYPPPKAHPLSGKTIINVTVSGWHPLPETMKRLEWARQARANGWNVILREVTANPEAFENATVKKYNRLHESLMKTDFFIMEQPLHVGQVQGSPKFGLPGCCKGSKLNPHTCDSCEVSEGLGKGFQGFWGIRETKAEKVLPDAVTSDQVIADEVNRTTQRLAEDVASPFSAVPVQNFRFDPANLDLPFKDKATLEKIANINFNHITDEAGILNSLEQVGQALEDVGAGEIMRRGTRSHRATKFAAVNPHTMPLAELIGRKPGEIVNAEKALKARYWLVASAQNLVGLSQKAASLQGTDLDKMAFVKALNLHAAVQAQVSGITAEAGRLLNQFNIIAKSTQGQARQIKEILENLPGGASVNDLAIAISTMPTPQQVGKFVNKVQHANTKDMFIEAWINSLLSGPTTHAVNVASNTLTTLLQMPERWLAGKFARVLKHNDSIAEGEAGEMAHGLIEGFRDALGAAYHVLRTGEGQDMISKIEQPFMKSITSENVRNLLPIKKLAPDALQAGGIPARAVDLLGTMIRIPTTALQAEDTFFKSVAYRMELRARAYREAVQKFPDDADKATEHMQKILADPEQFAPEIHLGAVDFARYSTYTNNLGKVGRAVQTLTTNPIMKMIVPFVRTPINILKFGMERTPFGIMKVLKAGSNAERDLALARMSLGTMAMTMCAAFAAGGMITGAGPTDPQLQANLRRTGWQPYSVKIGDKYYSYNRLEPLGMMIGLSADFAEMTAMATDDYEAMFDDFGDLATAMVASISKNVTSKTWLKGLSEFSMIFSDPEYYGSKWLEGMARTVIPTGVATAEKMVDPELSAVWGMMDAIKSRIPFYSRTLPPKRDFWGEPVSQRAFENNWLNGFYAAASPVYISEKKDSPIDRELTRLKVGLPNPRKTQTINGISIPLDPKEYDDLIVLRNKVPVMNGKNLRDSLNDVIKTPEYQAARADVKEDIIRDMVNMATELARNALYQENSTVRLYVDQEQLNQQANRE